MDIMYCVYISGFIFIWVTSLLQSSIFSMLSLIFSHLQHYLLSNTLLIKPSEVLSVAHPFNRVIWTSYSVDIYSEYRYDCTGSNSRMSSQYTSQDLSVFNINISCRLFSSQVSDMVRLCTGQLFDQRHFCPHVNSSSALKKKKIWQNVLRRVFACAPVYVGVHLDHPVQPARKQRLAKA